MNICKYLINFFRACFVEHHWRVYVVYPDGKMARLNLGKHDWNIDFAADPFLIRRNWFNWCFVETMGRDGKGKIACFKEDRPRHWKCLGVVLEQPWHLSYPQVFEEDGKVYMIPEQSALHKGDVSLYEATDFPYGWKKVKTLIDRPFADSTLLRKDGRYYLSCYTIPPVETAELWHAPSLLGPWTRHPQWKNVNQSPRLRRCGGAWRQEGIGLCRIAQDCNGWYGKRLFKIPVRAIDADRYEEGCASILLDAESWPHCKKHTFNAITVADGQLSVFDCQYPVLRPMGIALHDFMVRFAKKLKKISRM